MRIRKELLKAILENKVDRKFALFIKSSEYTPVFMRIGTDTPFVGSTIKGRIEATPEELDVLEQIIDINRIEIGLEE